MITSYPTVALFRAMLSSLFVLTLAICATVLPAMQAVAERQIKALVSGREARDRLGRNLPEVAHAYGLTPMQLERHLEDSTLHIDQALRLIYVDPPSSQLEEFEEYAGIDQPLAASIVTPDAVQVFQLHSRPAATKTIYLDFDGHTTTDDSRDDRGRPIVTPPYNFEGTTGSFTAAERRSIYEIWQRVAEDFAPFDVNVTTEEPPIGALINSGSGDTAWGIRVCIGGSSWPWLSRPAAGLAAVGSFNWSSDTPAYVFPEQLPRLDRYIAKTASHEIGHAMGLDHHGRTSPVEEYYLGHGSGETGWFPIMGGGSSRLRSQWSKGEYPNANNQQQDDLAVISTQNGFSYRADDHSNSIAGATPLTPAPEMIAHGIIERRTDVDNFSFYTEGGIIQFTATGIGEGSNLDIRLTLRDNLGRLLQESNPPDRIDAGLSYFASSAGTYYVSVEGVGYGDLTTGYSDYGSLGQYVVAGSAPRRRVLSPLRRPTDYFTHRNGTWLIVPERPVGSGNFGIGTDIGWSTFQTTTITFPDQQTEPSVRLTQQPAWNASHTWGDLRFPLMTIPASGRFTSRIQMDGRWVCGDGAHAQLWISDLHGNYWGPNTARSGPIFPIPSIHLSHGQTASYNANLAPWGGQPVHLTLRVVSGPNSFCDALIWDQAFISYLEGD